MKTKHHQQTITAYDGEKEAGYICYEIEDAQTIIATETFVSPEMRGKKVASTLLNALADYARANNLRIRPQCSYVVTKFARDNNYQDVKID